MNCPDCGTLLIRVSKDKVIWWECPACPYKIRIGSRETVERTLSKRRENER